MSISAEKLKELETQTIFGVDFNAPGKDGDDCLEGYHLAGALHLLCSHTGYRTLFIRYPDGSIEDILRVEK